jgi:hypothetical protein
MRQCWKEWERKEAMKGSKVGNWDIYGITANTYS